MSLGSAVWLLGLLPWVGMAVYLLPGKGTPRAVPFLRLWKSGVASARQTAWRLPAAPVLLMLTALLLSIFAAAKPGWGVGKTGGEISIILDRGASMAVLSISKEPFRGVIRKMVPVAADVRVTLVPIPGTAVETTGEGWMAAANELSPTIIPTQLDQTITDRLRQSSGDVFVLSDQQINSTDPRVVQIWPDNAGDCVAITAIGAGLLPRPQVMVRLENHSSRKSVQLKITSGSSVLSRTIALPPRGQACDQFVDMDQLQENVAAEIDSDVEQNPWARAWLVRQRVGVSINVDRSVPECVRRISTVYTKDRTSGLGTRSILVSPGPLDSDQWGITIDNQLATTRNSDAIVTMPHALTQNVQAWPAGGTADLPVGFVAVVKSAGKTIVAVREKPCRQIWMNLQLDEWSKTADFVIFFGNAFDWLAGGDERFTSVVGGKMDATWPGIYPLAGDRQIAVNAGGYPAIHSSSIPVKIGSPMTGQKSIYWSSVILVVALLCLLMASVLQSTRLQY